MFHRRIFVCMVLLFLSALSPLQADETGKEVYKKTLAGTVFVLSKAGTGSGWIYDKEKKIVVTNYHVVAQEEKIAVPGDSDSWRIVADPVVDVMFPIAIGGDTVRERIFYVNNRKKFAIKARVLYADPQRDIAFLELDTIPKNATALKIASRNPEPGERVHSVGNPGASGSLWVYSSGNVRSVYSTKLRTAFGVHKFKVVETSSPINPGDSGGPVVNDAGEVVALVQSVKTNAKLMSNCVAVSEVEAIIDMALATKSPTSSTDYILAARALFITGKYQPAIEKLNKAIELDDDNAEAWRLRGSCYCNMLKFERAVVDMDQAIKLAPTGKIHYDRALCRYHTKDFSGSIHDCNRAIKLGYKTDGVYYSRGLAYSKFKSWDWCIADYTTALKKNPSNLAALTNRMGAYYNRSKTAGDADWHRSMNDARRLLRIAPPGSHYIDKAEYRIRKLIRWRDG